NRNTLQNVIKPFVDQLEQLHPAVARAQGRNAGPWLEYPWPTPLNSVAVPCRDLPNLADFGVRSARNATKQRTPRSSGERQKRSSQQLRTSGEGRRRAAKDGERQPRSNRSGRPRCPSDCPLQVIHFTAASEYSCGPTR